MFQIIAKFKTKADARLAAKLFAGTRADASVTFDYRSGEAEKALTILCHNMRHYGVNFISADITRT